MPESEIGVYATWQERERACLLASLEPMRKELAFLTPLYETCYKESYGIITEIAHRIDMLRKDIYWTEYRLANERY